ncbi:APC family permease [Pseudonocardia acaciae]|uniref:APC family permease n=1 Tax=Pseudonocardia acaciae TaxID=551276 RepID=UPI000A848A27|nr:amino acid permease [Pseudonocardia acaciae]
MHKSDGAPATQPPLRRGLGLREAVSLGVGGTIGGGIFVLIGQGAALAGPGVLISFGLAFVAALLIALPYAELSCRYPLAGGGYAMTRQVLGEHWGFVMGWSFWGGYIFVSGYVIVGFGGYLSALTGLPVVLGSLLLVAVCTAVNLGGVRLSGRWQNVVILLGIVVLAVFAFGGVLSLHPDLLASFLPAGLGGVAAATLVTFLAFGGFDMVAAAGEEVVEPRRNLPKAIILTLFLVLGLYVLVALAAVGTLSPEQLATEAPLADAAQRLAGPAGGTLMAVAALLTTAATANAVLIVTSRISFAMARDGLLPARLASVSRSTRVPWVTIALNGALFAVIAATVSIPLAAKIGGFLYVLHFVFPLVVLVVTRRRKLPSGEQDFRIPAVWLVMPLAFIACGCLFLTSGLIGLSGGGVWLLIGLVCHFSVVFARRRNAIGNQGSDDGGKQRG